MGILDGRISIHSWVYTGSGGRNFLTNRARKNFATGPSRLGAGAGARSASSAAWSTAGIISSNDTIAALVLPSSTTRRRVAISVPSEKRVDRQPGQVGSGYEHGRAYGRAVALGQRLQHGRAMTACPAFRLRVLADRPIGDAIPPGNGPDGLIADLVGAADGMDRYFRVRWHGASKQ